MQCRPLPRRFSAGLEGCGTTAVAIVAACGTSGARGVSEESVVRIFMHCLAVFLATTAIVAIYGTWPRSESGDVVVPFSMESVECDDHMLYEEPMESPVNYAGQCYYGFADNFDCSTEELDRALKAIRVVENRSGDTNAVGDIHLRHKAYGLYQIRQPYLDDVNRLAGTHNIQALWGKPRLTVDDMRDMKKADWVARRYLEYYGRRYERQTGKEVTAGVYARIHNGGPNGWMKASTNAYLRQVMEELE